MFKQIILVSAFAVLAYAELPVSGPYPPSGWKPQGAPFNLPRESLPQPKRQPEQPVQVEISEEKVEFAGQFGETTTFQPSNAYLPPSYTDAPEDIDNSSTEDFLKVQGLPSSEPAQQFAEDNAIQSGQLNRFQGQQYRQPRPQPQQQFGRVQQKPQFVNRQAQFARQTVAVVPSNQYGAPLPARQYGAPRGDFAETQAESEERLPSSQSDEVDSDAEDVQSPVANGQYYVLTPDRTLQRVVFMTTQNEREARTNGFSAQLKYAPIESIKDPIYTYNAQGTLTRIYRKK